MRTLPSWLGLLGTLALGLPAPADAQPVGSEFQINTYTTDDQDSPSVASDGRGNFVVVWSSHGQDGHIDGVFGQRYDSDANPVGGEFRVNSYTTLGQDQASVASDAIGNFVVVWSGQGAGDGQGVFGQRFDKTGEPQGSEFRVNSYTTNRQDDASVASDAIGNFVVVWKSRNNPGGFSDDVIGQRYDSAGELLGGEFRVNSYTRAFETSPSVASDASGNFVVTWVSGTMLVNRGVFGQRFDSNGAPQGGEFLVDARSGPPTVASDAAGNFVVVWHNTSLYGDQDVYGRRYDSAGVPQGPTFRVNSYTVTVQADPSVASDASGNFVVAWESNEQDGSYAGIFAQRYDSAGVALGEEFRINSYTTGFQENAAVGATGTNEFVVAWQSADVDGDGDGVFGQRYDFGSGGEAISVVSPNTNVKWRIGSLQRIQWTHNLGADAMFRIELDRDNDGDYEELIADDAPVDIATKGSFAWTVTGPRSGTARVRVSWTHDLAVSDSSDVTFQIRPVGLD